MSISEFCKVQQAKADRIFMDFKYTEPGSPEQNQSLKTLNNLIVQWAQFLASEEKKITHKIAAASSMKV